MSPYSFDFFKKDGSFDAFDVGAFADHGEATRQGCAELFASPTAIAVEVWHQSSLVAVVTRSPSAEASR